MSVSLNTQISANAYQTNQNLKPKISKENEILKNQIVAIGMTNPDKASMLSRKIVMWDGSQKALDDLSAEGLNVSELVVSRLLGGMTQEDAYPMIEAFLGERRFQEAANILCRVDNLSDFSGFKKYLENNRSAEFSLFKQALIDLSQSNPKASDILSRHFGYDRASSSRGLVVPNQLVPQTNMGYAYQWNQKVL